MQAFRDSHSSGQRVVEAQLDVDTTVLAGGQDSTFDNLNAFNTGLDAFDAFDRPSNVHNALAGFDEYIKYDFSPQPNESPRGVEASFGHSNPPFWNNIYPSIIAEDTQPTASSSHSATAHCVEAVDFVLDNISAGVNIGLSSGPVTQLQTFGPDNDLRAYPQTHTQSPPGISPNCSDLDASSGSMFLSNNVTEAPLPQSFEDNVGLGTSGMEHFPDASLMASCSRMPHEPPASANVLPYMMSSKYAINTNGGYQPYSVDGAPRIPFPSPSSFVSSATPSMAQGPHVWTLGPEQSIPQSESGGERRAQAAQMFVPALEGGNLLDKNHRLFYPLHAGYTYPPQGTSSRNHLQPIPSSSTSAHYEFASSVGATLWPAQSCGHHATNITTASSSRSTQKPTKRPPLFGDLIAITFAPPVASQSASKKGARRSKARAKLSRIKPLEFVRSLCSPPPQGEAIRTFSSGEVWFYDPFVAKDPLPENSTLWLAGKNTGKDKETKPVKCMYINPFEMAAAQSGCEPQRCHELLKDGGTWMKHFVHHAARERIWMEQHPTSTVEPVALKDPEFADSRAWHCERCGTCGICARKDALLRHQSTSKCARLRQAIVGTNDHHGFPSSFPVPSASSGSGNPHGNYESSEAPPKKRRRIQ